MRKLLLIYSIENAGQTPSLPSPLRQSKKKKREKPGDITQKERVIGWRFYISFQENSNRLWELMTSYWSLCLFKLSFEILVQGMTFFPCVDRVPRVTSYRHEDYFKEKWRQTAIWWEMLHLLLVFSWCGSGCLLGSNYLWLSSLVGSAPIQFSQDIEQHQRNDCSPPNRILRFWLSNQTRYKISPRHLLHQAMGIGSRCCCIMCWCWLEETAQTPFLSLKVTLPIFLSMCDDQLIVPLLWQLYCDHEKKRYKIINMSK